MRRGLPKGPEHPSGKPIPQSQAGDLAGCGMENTIGSAGLEEADPSA